MFCIDVKHTKGILSSSVENLRQLTKPLSTERFAVVSECPLSTNTTTFTDSTVEQPSSIVPLILNNVCRRITSVSVMLNLYDYIAIE
ncbi:hypothetical protein DICVIV_14384 [Dictyocaulus viviparus]|uniref:Uncharacterized protein n=1 Tax=Dictyocaulus viviparus TaxID=29172 RepID=A0A0D8X5C9_DICVI|nr:hypothetical protein DICVIV_14384 [Dictyocaulus viviparus]